ncbi:MAG TPA: VWA domain-containing protein [Thermoanaerobaculia bacterium]|nr:VWA domain-containing protein [Thermoanaerobaculia bacterium]
MWNRAAVRSAVLVVLALGFGAVAHAQSTCGPMDVVFVIDNTGSMTEVIAQVQQQVNDIADAVTVSSGGDAQFGLVVAPSNDVVVLLDLAKDNRAALTDAVAQMTTIGSCGEPAEWDQALYTVLNNSAAGRTYANGVGTQVGDFTGQFRANATKLIIVVTDARPGGTTGCDYLPGDSSIAFAMADNARSRGILLATVFVPTSSAEAYGFIPTVRSVLQSTAAITDSVFMETKADASNLANILKEVIITCGSGRLGLDPKELVLDNGETGTIHVTNYRPGSSLDALTYRASGLPEDSTFKFTRMTPQLVGTDLQSLDITIGPDTPAGVYVVPVSVRAASGRVSADYVLVYVGCVPPMILATPGHQPESTNIAAGMRAKLTVAPGGSPGFKYQWYRGHRGLTNFPVEGANGPEFTTPVMTAGSSEEYWVRVSNACGSTDSATATVSVNP